ncbi:restriction endonuclease subunit S [Aeromonas hydrophila]|uniref:restriction endonuclease subunit S n=1 Tax=Aeromonas hydrophila TaxID=644 RepID=UPI003EC6165E
MMSELDVLNDNHTSISLSTPSVSGISKIHKGVPKDWAKGTTKDLIDHMSSGLSRRLVEHDIGIPVLISGNIQNNKLVVDELKYWYSDDPQGAKIENYVLNEGDILLCFINSLAQIGKPCVYRDIGRPAIYTTNLFRIIIDKSCDGRFAYYLFCTDTFQKDLQLIAKTAVNQASFTKPDFLNINICYPINIKEQTAIANVLSDSDALIGALEQLIAKKQAIKSATMQQLLTGRTRLPAFALRPDGTPKGYKPSELGDIPEDWEVKSVYALANNQKALFDDGDWIEAEHITDKGVRLIQTGNIGIGSFIEKDVKKYVYEKSFESLRCKELHIGDLLICRLAEPAGRACILPYIGEAKVITSVDVTIFRPERNIANRDFLVQYFSSTEWLKSVQEQVGGTTHKRISRGALGQLLMPYPSLDEQTAIATILSDMDNELQALTQKLEKARALKQGMMQQLLTGKIRLPLAAGA